MASKKPSANKKKVAQFKSSIADFGDIFESESSRIEEIAEERKSALRNKACDSKNRYATRKEAEEAAAWCAVERNRNLRIYRCKYCGGWHLTSKSQ
ncbi:MAG: hypothetical protein IJ087_13030 [Eggerthellaceae bacterium]|nr:hypothetical protein [Eggerthellaceae bacterium]